MTTDFLADIWNAAKQGGPFGMMLLLMVLYFVNEERKALSKENAALHEKNAALVERLLTGLNDVNSTIKDLRDILFGGARKT